MAVFTANKTEPYTHGLKVKPLSDSARAIVEKLLSKGGIQQGGGTATDLGEDLKEEAQPGAGPAEQDVSDARGETKRSPYSVAKRHTDRGGPSAAPAGKERSDKKPKDPAPGSEGGAGSPVGPFAAFEDGNASVLQPTPTRA